MFEKCTRLWRKGHVEVKMYKALHIWATFGRRLMRRFLLRDHSICVSSKHAVVFGQHESQVFNVLVVFDGVFVFVFSRGYQ